MVLHIYLGIAWMVQQVVKHISLRMKIYKGQ
jgi:hypothetical protein